MTKFESIHFYTIVAAREYCDKNNIPHSEIHNDYYSGCPFILVEQKE